MSWSMDKSGEITISGWEAGIAPSPHTGNGVQGTVQGVADLKGVNISSIKGEVSVAYDRVRVDQPAVTGGTFTVNSGTPTQFAYSGNLSVGTWIKVTTHTGSPNVTNGHYYFVEPIVQGVDFKLFSDFGTTQITASGSGTITFDTLAMGVPISYTVENSGAASSNSYRYYVLDNNGVIWVSGTSDNAGASPSAPSTIMTWAAITPHGAVYGVNSTVTQITYGGSISVMYSTDTSNIITGSYLILFTDSQIYYMKNTTGWTSVTGTDLSAWQSLNYANYPHRSYLGYDQTLYFTDGPTLGFIREKPLQYYNTTATIPAGATSATLTSAWTQATGSYSVLFSDGETKSVTFTGNSVAISWTGGLSAASSTLLTLSAQSFDPASSSTYDLVLPNYLLPPEDAATFISSIPANSGSISIVVGGLQNNLYFFPTVAQQTTPGPETVLWMPEANTQYLIQANNYVFVFCGSKGNIYLTNGNSVISVMTVPDYIAGAKNFTQDPYFTWGGAMYLRGRIFFSIKDQNANHTGNCGGVWSFAPTFAAFFNQDVGIALRMEGTSSLYSTEGFQGYAPIIFSGNETTAQDADGPQYIACWSQGDNSGSNVVNSIDFSGTDPLTNSSAIIETDAIPIGTFLEPKTYSQLELKFAAALVSGETATVYYRTDLEAAWATAGTLSSQTAALSNGSSLSQIIQGLSFQQVQMVQFRVVLNSTTSSPSWCRLKEIYLR